MPPVGQPVSFLTPPPKEGHGRVLDLCLGKELRFDCDDGKWRVAFAFDPQRTAVLLVAGNKVGADSDFTSN